MEIIELLNGNHTEFIKIKLTENFKQKVWQKIKNIDNEVTRYRSYLNLLARRAFISWLGLMLEQEITDNIPLENHLSIWEFVNGNALEINSTKIVLIPTETDDRNQISIPAEWLKIPDWVGNYYLAVEVNLDEDYLCFWGYTSYEKIINDSQLDTINYHYDLDEDFLENDLDLIILAYEYAEEKIPQIEPISLLSTVQKQELVSQIKDELFPRYYLDFSQWLSLISDPEICHNLYTLRQPIHLSEWLNQQIESTIVQGWQQVENAIDNLFSPNLSLQPSFSARRHPISLSEALEILTPNQDPETINETLAMIPSLAQSDRNQVEIINTLANLIVNHNDEEVRWNTALSLEKISQDHPLCPLWYQKEINLGDNSIALLFGLLSRNNEQISIFVRVYNLDNHNYLPDKLILQIIDENNNIFEEVISSKYDSIIQYKFWGNKGEKFQLKLIIDDIFVNLEFRI
jgi:hypothetical protein